MTDLEYRPGKLMEVQPINVRLSEVVGTLRLNEPIVAILEPGDATRYTLLLVPMRVGDGVSPYLQGFGIQQEDADRYLFVSKLSGYECPGTWVPFVIDRPVGVHDVTELTDNPWSQQLLAWWLTNLCEASF